MAKQEFKGITKRGKSLLDDGENKIVDYKAKINGLHAEDLVAFANSKKGGVILIGVKEGKKENGQQTGIPVGCTISDKNKLKIMGKALSSCSPPVHIELFVENLSAMPFYRIEIPSGQNKPYCTNSGTYKIREDGRNNPLHPEQLLSIFLDREGEEFRARFSQATGELENKMGDTLKIVGELEDLISIKIDEISSSMGMAEWEAEEAKSKIEDVESYVIEINRRSRNLDNRVKSIISHIEATDPVKEKAKEEVLKFLIQKLEDDEDLFNAAKSGKSLSVSFSGDLMKELQKEDLNKLLTKAIKAIEKNDA